MCCGIVYSSVVDESNLTVVHFFFLPCFLKALYTGPLKKKKMNRFQNNCCCLFVSPSVFLTLLFSVICMMSNVADGLDIMGMGEEGWKTNAVKVLKGAVLQNGGDGDGDVLEQTKEIPVRRKLEEHRSLVDDCAAFVKGNAFNMVNAASCNLKITTKIDGGETLRVRGTDGLDHPELMRGGYTQCDSETCKVRAHHFVMNGDSALTLMNLKLSGAYSGHKGNCEFYCTIVS